MAVTSHGWQQRVVALGVSVVVAATIGCTEAPVPSGLGTKQLTASQDTVPGTGSLAELEERRAAWVAQRIDDYTVELRISCFCGSDRTRPVLVEVRGGTVARVTDLETAKPRASTDGYPSITALFDMAIAERSRDGHVSVTYDGASGIPVRLEIGTLANDAGTLYLLGGLRAL